MTLIELLVAMALLSLLAVGVMFACLIGLSAMERTNNRLEDEPQGARRGTSVDTADCRHDRG